MKTLSIDERIEQFRKKRKYSVIIAIFLSIACLGFAVYSTRHMIEELRRVDLTNLSPDTLHIIKALGHFAVGYSVLWLAISILPSFFTKPYDSLVFHLYDRIKSLEDNDQRKESSEQGDGD